MTQKERQERSREQIYQAALEEFGMHGYDAVNMEQICTRHSISKGMMYHYYSGKDDLFLLCVERTFMGLKTRIEQDMQELPQRDVLHTIKDYFMIREYYFELHPLEKGVFETAVLHTPSQLKEQIITLRAPLQEINRIFLSNQISRMPLRDGLDRQDVMHYLESVKQLFGSLMRTYRSDMAFDLHAMLDCAEHLLELLLFGILRQDTVLSTDLKIEGKQTQKDSQN